jgi:hypothetical protein
MGTFDRRCRIGGSLVQLELANHSSTRRTAAIVLAASLLIGSSGCGRTSSPNAQPSAPAPVPEQGSNRPARDASDAPESFEGTAGIVSKPKPNAPVATLRAVRTARHETFDRVVFEFEGATAPGYHVEYIDRPVRTCGSGEVVPLAGDGWLEIRLQPAAAHDEAGNATVEARAFGPDLPVLSELRLTCDFEADVTWVLGLRSPNRYRVLELSNPVRLVVDVKHD